MESTALGTRTNQRTEPQTPQFFFISNSQ